MIYMKRIYDQPQKMDGCRILVDKLWPRGMSKDKAKVDCWLREIAPSDELRKWFSHDPLKWREFRIRYGNELKEKSVLVAKIKQLEKEKRAVTLLYSAKDEKHNNAVVLKEKLK